MQKLQKELEELLLRGGETQSFPGPAVDFVLDLLDEVVRHVAEIETLGKILSDELVHVLDGAFLPGGVGVGEVNRGAQGLRNPLMAGELAPVVGGDRVHLFAVREEEFHHLVGHPLGVLAPGQAGQEQEVDRAFAKGEDGALLALADNQVHLPVPEPVTVRFPGPFMDADAPWQVPHLGFLGPLLVPPVLHPVAAMFPQLPALILPDVLVQGLMGDGFPLQGQMAGYLAG